MYNRKPAWWQLFALLPLMVGAVLLVNHLGWGQTAGTVADVLVIVATFAAMGLWMSANETAIEVAEHEQLERARAQVRRQTRPWRSEPSLRAKLDSRDEKLPASGFGWLSHRVPKE